MNLSVLISSHAKAFDLWNITHFFFKKNWPNCPYAVYLGANGENRIKYCPEDWIYLNKGEDVSWAKSMKSYLESIPADYILLFLDDFIILRPVNQKLIDEAYEFLVANNGVMLRLVPSPKGTIYLNENFRRIDVKNRVPYVTSLQVAIWKKSFLIKLLKYDFDPWEFEIKAGKVKESMECYDKFFVTTKPLIFYKHFVEKGKFYPFIRKLIKEYNIPLIDTNRETLNKNELIKLYISKLRATMFSIIPEKDKNKIRKYFGKHEL
ncbi:hypothetical protein HRbin19_00992 [bacterium HR19]|nr:hypothetical protein HRbin19_00992 [bacterium HR19]